MFYTLVNGTLDTVNCLPGPQPDISGFGIRYTHYFQAFLSILLSFKKPSSWDMILNNLVCQAVSISLVVGVYFDQGVDILHSIMASHFVVLMMVCTLTPSFAARESRESREARKSMRLNGLIWVLDTLTKPGMLLYNCGLWVMIRRFQRSGTENPCRQGAGYFLLFGGIYPLKSASTATDLAFAITLLQAINHSFQLIAEISRQWKIRNQGPSPIQRHTEFDAMIWWLWKLHRMKSDTVIWDWDKISKWLTRISHLFKLLTFIYIFIAIEISILANHIPLPPDNDKGWTITQIFSISTLFLLFGITFHRYNLLSELIRTPLPSSHSNFLAPNLSPILRG